MILPQPKDAYHKAWLYRTLSAIINNAYLSQHLHFKGGTAAAILGRLDRFSVDLDFDKKHTAQSSEISHHLETIFKSLGLTIKDKSSQVPQYFLKYPVHEANMRCTLKIDVNIEVPKNNTYEYIKLPELEKFCSCHTIETMFANKLVSIIDRYEKNTSIACRDLYDIHHFFLKGYQYSSTVILERRSEDSVKDFFATLITFIESKISSRKITEDIAPLLPYKTFTAIRSILKDEVLMFLRSQ